MPKFDLKKLLHGEGEGTAAPVKIFLKSKKFFLNIMYVNLIMNHLHLHVTYTYNELTESHWSS